MMNFDSMPGVTTWHLVLALVILCTVFSYLVFLYLTPQNRGKKESKCCSCCCFWGSQHEHPKRLVTGGLGSFHAVPYSASHHVDQSRKKTSALSKRPPSSSRNRRVFRGQCKVQHKRSIGDNRSVGCLAGKTDSRIFRSTMPGSTTNAIASSVTNMNKMQSIGYNSGKMGFSSVRTNADGIEDRILHITGPINSRTSVQIPALSQPHAMNKVSVLRANTEWMQEHPNSSRTSVQVPALGQPHAMNQVSVLRANTEWMQEHPNASRTSVQVPALSQPHAMNRVSVLRANTEWMQERPNASRTSVQVPALSQPHAMNKVSVLRANAEWMQEHPNASRTSMQVQNFGQCNTHNMMTTVRAHPEQGMQGPSNSSKTSVIVPLSPAFDQHATHSERSIAQSNMGGQKHLLNARLHQSPSKQGTVIQTKTKSQPRSLYLLSSNAAYSGSPEVTQYDACADIATRLSEDPTGKRDRKQKLISRSGQSHTGKIEALKPEIHTYAMLTSAENDKKATGGTGGHTVYSNLYESSARTAPFASEIMDATMYQTSAPAASRLGTPHNHVYSPLGAEDPQQKNRRPTASPPTDMYAMLAIDPTVPTQHVYAGEYSRIPAVNQYVSMPRGAKNAANNPTSPDYHTYSTLAAAEALKAGRTGQVVDNDLYMELSGGSFAPGQYENADMYY